MISRRITRRKQSRRLLVAMATIGVISGAFYFGASALATTPANQFELEGNATSATGSGGAAPDDWDRVCHQATGGTVCATADNTHSATAVAWAEDVHGAIAPLSACSGTNCTIFTGGGSKDPQDINQWAWKDNVGGLPDKDNLLHGFAARYSKPSSPTCQGPNGDTSGATKCDMLYFGNDRYDNSGDAQQGFWFFQNKIGLGTNSVGGGNGFTSSGGSEFHRLGDLLLISDFSNGGDVSTITVYTWDPGCSAASKPPLVSGVSCGDANLRFQASSDSANCANNGNVDPAVSGFCGIVNPNGNTAAPWPFVDKTTTNNTTHLPNTYLQGELYEGGVNLGFLNLQSECFASIASETRSSTSTTATLKDFVLGNFGDCTSHITTTPGNSSGTALTDHNSNSVPDVSIGTGSVQVRDHAVVTVNGAQTWTGTVSFKLCGPLALNSTSNCTSGGATIPYTGGANGTVTNAANTKDSGLATLTRVGRYCWSATFTSGTNGVPNSTDPDPGPPASTSVSECFEVLPVQPTMTTSASGPVAKGGTLSDTATISGVATQPGTGGLGDGSINPTTAGLPDAGSITWRALGPNNCTTVAMASTSRTISGPGTYPTASQTAVSFTASSVGLYTFVAGYSTTNPNNLGIDESACPDTTHTEEARAGDSSITTTPGDSTGAAIATDVNNNTVKDVSIGTGSVVVRDHATVSVTGGITPWSGTVSFKLCGPLAFTPITTNCASGGVSIPFGAGENGNVSNSSPSVNSGAATLTKAGRYCWQATFTSSTTGIPNSTDPSASSTSTTECFEVLPVQPTMTTQAGGSVVLGNAMTDTATISGLATQPGTGGLGDGSINPTTPGAADAGSISWTVKGPNNCNASGLTVTPSSITISGNNTYGPVSATPVALGLYTWVASFSTTNPNNLNIGASACPDTTHTEEVTVTGVSHLITDQDWLPNDTATLTGDSNLNGSLTFTLYSDLTCGTTGGTVKYTENVTVSNATSGSTFGTHNGSVPATTFRATATGNYSWKVTYDDSTLSDPGPSCETTSLTIANNH